MLTPYRAARCLLFLTLGCHFGRWEAAAAQVAAEPATLEVLQHLPDDALGFVLVHNLGDADAKTQRLLTTFRVTTPGPLALVQLTTGLGEGLDKQGDALLAFLPGAHNLPDLIPMLLAPVEDYGKFAASAGGDESGEICRVTIGGEDVLAARDGDFALLMNVEHRETMELLLAADPAPVADVEPLRTWLEGNVVAAVLLPTGADLLVKLGEAQLDAQRARIEARWDGEENAERLAEEMLPIDMGRDLLDAARGEFHALAAGLAADDELNMRLTMRAVLQPDSELAALGEVKRQENPLAGYAAGPVVGYGEVVAASAWGDAMLRFYERIIASAPEEFGYGAMTKEDWARFRESQSLVSKGVRSYSMIMRPGEGDDPIVSQFYGIVHVDDAAEVIANWEKSFEISNEVMGKFQTEIDFQYEVERRDIAGKPGMEISIDMAKAMGDPNVPAMDAVAKAIFGENGVMRFFLVAADDHTLVMGAAGEGEVVELMTAYQQGESGLADSEIAAKTAQLLDPEAPWQGVVSPAGYIAWLERAMKTMLQNMGAFMTPPDFPEFPESPPIGFSARVVDGHLAFEVVMAGETAEAISTFAKEVEEMDGL